MLLLPQSSTAGQYNSICGTEPEPRKRCAALVAAIAFLATAAATAPAPRVRIARGTVVFAAAPGEANAVSVGAVGNGVRLSDSSAVLDAVPSCRALGTTEAVCRWGANGGDNALVADLGDGDDSIAVASSFVEPIPGLEVEEGLDGAAVLRGGSGNDAISGGSEVDEIDGGLGSDRIDGGRAPTCFITTTASVASSSICCEGWAARRVRWTSFRTSSSPRAGEPGTR